MHFTGHDRSGPEGKVMQLSAIWGGGNRTSGNHQLHAGDLQLPVGFYQVVKSLFARKASEREYITVGFQPHFPYQSEVLHRRGNADTVGYHADLLPTVTLAQFGGNSGRYCYHGMAHPG